MESPVSRGSPAKSPKKSKTFNFDVQDRLAKAEAEAQHQQFQVAERDIEIERMKTTLQGLNQNLEVAQDYKAESVEYHVSFTKSEDIRTNQLQKFIEETAAKIKVDTAAHDAKHQEDARVINDLNENIQALNKRYDAALEAHLTEVNNNLASYNATYNQLTKDAKTAADNHAAEQHSLQTEWLNKTKSLQDEHANTLNARDSAHNSELRELERIKVQRERDHLDAVKNLNQRHEDTVSRLQAQHNEEIDRLRQEIRQMTEQQRQQNDRHNTERREQNDRHDTELRRFRDEQERKDQENRRAIEALRAEYASKFASQQAEHDRVNRAREDRFKREREEFNRMHEAKVLELQQAMEAMRVEKDLEIKNLHIKWAEERTTLTLKIDELTAKILVLERQLLEKTSIIISLEQIVEKKADVERQLAEALDRENKNREAREKLRRELDEATDAVFELEEKVYKANITSFELLKQLKDAEIEIETLKQYIIDLKQRIAVYIPVKEDAIDKRLAEYINNYPERSKLKIMFMRESSGVYQFGTKRVQVKVERDSIKIRVGGGYLSIDQFLEQYTPAELEKLERKDPLKRMSEKIAIQSTIKTQGVREDSPVRRSAAGSPKKQRMGV